MFRPAIGLCFAMTLGLSAVAAVPSAVMTFSPPDTIKYLVKQISVQTRYTDTTVARVDSTTMVTDYLLTKSVSGFTLIGTPRPAVYTQNGVKIENEVSRISSGIPVTLDINVEGRALSATGYDLLGARIDSLPDKKMSQMLKRLFKPQALADQDVKEWNSRIGRLKDQRLRVGVLSGDTASLKLGNGPSIQLYSVTAILDTVRRDGVLCAVVRSATYTDIAALAKAIKKSPAETKALLKLADSLKTPADAHTWYRATTDVTIDAATLLIRDEKVRRDIQTPVTGKDGKPVNSRMVESIEKTYEYPKH